MVVEDRLGLSRGMVQEMMSEGSLRARTEWDGRTSPVWRSVILSDLSADVVKSDGRCPVV